MCFVMWFWHEQRHSGKGRFQHFGFGGREKQRRKKKEIICTRIDTRLFFPRARTLLFSYLSINLPVRLYYLTKMVVRTCAYQRGTYVSDSV